MKKTIFNKNFILVIIGQIISLFGNTMLRFALPLYTLQETGSAVIFGSILAIAMIPTILLSPFGGMLADRVSKKWIMVILDIITALVTFVFIINIHSISNVVVVVTILLVTLSIIQSFYQPAVQSSIPLIVEREKILEANAVVSLVNSLATLLGPVLGGIFFGYFGIIPLTIVSSICFIFAAILELFISIKHIPQEKTGNLVEMIKSDFKVSMNFILKEKPVMFKTLLLATGINLVLSAMILVGYPIFITMKLGLSSQMYGLCEGILAAGAIAGGLSVGIISKKISLDKFYLTLVFASVLLIPIAIPFMFELSVSTSYIIFCIAGFLIMSMSTIFSIRLMSFMQEQTPEHLLGKVISYVLTLAMFALPIGQFIYGYLYNEFIDHIGIIIIIGALVSLVISLGAKKTFLDFK